MTEICVVILERQYSSSMKVRCPRNRSPGSGRRSLKLSDVERVFVAGQHQRIDRSQAVQGRDKRQRSGQRRHDVTGQGWRQRAPFGGTSGEDWPRTPVTKQIGGG